MTLSLSLALTLTLGLSLARCIPSLNPNPRLEPSQVRMPEEPLQWLFAVFIAGMGGRKLWTLRGR